MRVSARAVIKENGKVLLMHRIVVKNGEKREYYVLPGGGQEGNETLEQTVVRELKEEMNINVHPYRYLGQTTFEDSEKHFFECDIVDGFVSLGGEEAEKNNPNNFYEPVWLEIEKVDNFNVIDKEFINK
ncbi:MAG: NUDIX domain-containing protein [Clostridia bacterium]|nr:NUDIX domain-containing protein [Clostridia bacterium]